MSNLRRRACLASIALTAAPFVVTEPAAAGGDCHRSETQQTEETGTTVEMSAVCMNPTVLRTEVGEEVTFVNRDPMAHNAIGVGWGVQDLAPEESGAHTFDRAGTYPFACSLHPGMVGAVVVGEGEPGAAEATSPAAPPSPPAEESSSFPLVPIGLAAVGASGLVAVSRAVGSRAARRRVDGGAPAGQS